MKAVLSLTWWVIESGETALPVFCLAFVGKPATR